MDCRPRLASSIYPWFRIRVYLLLDGLPTKAVELHVPGFGIRSCPSPRLCRSTAPYSILFRCNPPKGELPHPPPRGHAPTPYSPSARVEWFTFQKFINLQIFKKWYQTNSIEPFTLVARVSQFFVDFQQEGMCLLVRWYHFISDAPKNYILL